MNSIRWWTGAAVLGMTLVINQFPCNAAGDDKTKTDNDKSTTSRSSDGSKSTGDSRKVAFLGIMVEELHPAFASHLPSAGLKGQGLMVEDVGSDTPASKAGIKTHDILMTYDDQKLFTPEQFVKLIHGDKAGREVSLGLIREGKSQTIKVQLGEHEARWGHHHLGMHSPHHRPFGFGWPGQGQGHSGTQVQDSDNPTWNSFDSLTLKKLDKDRFRASVAYTDKDGKLQKHDYEGTRDEIRKKIDGDKDLLPNERNHLVRGLDLEDGNLPIFLFPDEHGLNF